MALSAGDKLGPYEILEPIGKGGMGEVYRAHDERLRRDVAIKTSAEQFSDRFTREARAIASLNHTNICHLYDVGASPDAPGYLVMEYVEGEDLQGPMSFGPMSFDDALPIIQQLIDGIEAAHEKNIIHRDLKPANIKITPDGVVKILDFGLAKAMEAPNSAETDPTNSPTITMGATQAGTILGTAAYMSPEQAKGKTADKRSDIWSFGVIVYELLTGERMFTGESAVEILSGVLHKDPDLSAAPPRVQRLLRWCLEKDRKKRLASISDARGLLEEPVPVAAELDGETAGGRSWLWPGVAAALAVGLIATLVLWAPWQTPPPEDRPLVRLDVDLGPDVALPTADMGGRDVTISRDGTRLAYVSGTPPRLFTRRLDQANATELAGTEGANNPQFFPDGEWLLFKAGSKLNKISVEGGAVVPLGDVDTWAGSDWDQEGNILVSQAFSKGMWRIPAAGGEPETLLELTPPELAFALPQVLPEGKGILFTMQTGRSQENRFEVLNPRDGKRTTVGRGGTNARFIPAAASTSGGALGHLIYNNESTLFAVPFDLEKLEALGAAVPILNDVAFQMLSGAGSFAVSDTGTLIYRRTAGAQLSRLEWVDPATREPLGSDPTVYAGAISLSPDGTRVALGLGSRANVDLWIYDLTRDSTTRISRNPGTLPSPTWSPDGRDIFFGGLTGIMRAPPDGSSPPRVFLESQEFVNPESFTADGKFLSILPVTDRRIGIVPVEQQKGQWIAGEPQFQPVSPGLNFPVFSPDGKWLTYTSPESGTTEVYVRPAPDSDGASANGRWQISNNGGNLARWSRDGRTLVYQEGNRMMTVDYTVQGGTFVPGTPRVWIDNFGTEQWDLAPDGKRVIALMPVEDEQPPQADHEIVMLENFFDELRRRAPLE